MPPNSPKNEIAYPDNSIRRTDNSVNVDEPQKFDMSHIAETVIDSQPSENVIPEESNFCEFMAKNSIIGEMITHAGIARVTRITIIFTHVQVVIMASAGGLELSFEWYYAGLMAAAVSVIVEEILTKLLFTNALAQFGGREIIGLILVIVINMGSIICQTQLGLARGETFNNDWILATGVGFAAFCLVGKQICSIVQYALKRMG